MSDVGLPLATTLLSNGDILRCNNDDCAVGVLSSSESLSSMANLSFALFEYIGLTAESPIS